MGWSSLLITAALSLFVICGLIDAINAQRGSVRFNQRPSSSASVPFSSSSSAAVFPRSWADDDTALLVSEENFSRSETPSFRRRISTPQTSAAALQSTTAKSNARRRSRPTVQAQSRSSDVTSGEVITSRRTTKEQPASSLRSEVVYQNTFSSSTDRSSEERNRRKGRQRGFRKEVVQSSTVSSSSSITVSNRRSEKTLNRLTGQEEGKSSSEKETLARTPLRSLEGRARGSVKALPSVPVEEVDSEENYPEQFKKLLRAKLQEGKVKNVYPNVLEVSTVKGNAKSRELDELPRFKVKVQSPTTSEASTTVKHITPRPIRKLEIPSTTAETAAVPVPDKPVTISPRRQSPGRSRLSSSSTTTTTTTTTTESQFETTTPKLSRAFSRKPSVVSLLTSTTTVAPTTTRKPYYPASRSPVTVKRTFSTTTEATGAKDPVEQIAPKQTSSDNGFVIASLRNPAPFRSALKKNRKQPTASDYSGNDLKPIIIPSRSKAPPSLSALKRSQSSSAARVGTRLESSLKKAPVYTPTVPTFTAPSTTFTTTPLDEFENTFMPTTAPRFIDATSFTTAITTTATSALLSDDSHTESDLNLLASTNVTKSSLTHTEHPTSTATASPTTTESDPTTITAIVTSAPMTVSRTTNPLRNCSDIMTPQSPYIVTPIIRVLTPKKPLEYYPRFQIRPPVFGVAQSPTTTSTSTSTSPTSTTTTSTTSTTRRPVPVVSTASSTRYTAQLTTPRPRSRGIVVYGILPNNTVIRRIIGAENESPSTTENPRVVFGIYPNGTVVRRYPNGTIVPDRPARRERVEITDIDPRELRNPNSAIYRESATHTVAPVTSTTPAETTSAISTATITTTSSPTSTTTISNDATGTTAIIAILRKYNEENQLDTKVKSDAVFSLAVNRGKKVDRPAKPTAGGDISVVKANDEVRVARPDAPDLIYRWAPTSSSSSEPTTPAVFTTDEAVIADNTVPDNIVEFKSTSIQPTDPNLSRVVSSTVSGDVGVRISGDLETINKQMADLELNNFITSTILSVSEEPSTTSTRAPSTSPPTTTTSTTTTTTTEKPTTTTTTTTQPPPPSTTTTTTTSTSTTQAPVTTTVQQTPKPNSKVQDDHLETNFRLLQLYVEANQKDIAATKAVTFPTTVLQSSSRIITEPRTTTPSTTSTTTTTTPRSTTTTTTRATTRTSPKPKQNDNSRFNLNSLFAPTTQRTRTSTYSDADDLAFLRQLANFLNGGQTTRRTTKKPTTKKTTTTTSTTSTTTTTTTTTETPTTTTTPSTTTMRRPSTGIPLSTVIVENDDADFLNDVRKLPNFATPNPLVDSSLANRILQLAINRDPKSISLNNQLNVLPTTTTLSPQEIENTKKQLNKELQNYNNDIRLLSTLLGRPITSNDIPELTKRLTTTTLKPSTPRATTTMTTTTSTTTTQQPPLNPVLLQALLLKQQQQHNSSPAAVENVASTYGKTNEAILASVLKQRGIGPTNTNANLEEILAKISPRTGTATVLPIITTTTSRPRPRTARPPVALPPLQSSRPILDGLTWLWREWQATAPQPRQRLPGSSLIASPPPSEAFSLSAGGRVPSQSQAYRDEGLDPDAKPINPSVTEEPPSLFGGLGAINPGGQLLNAAIGVTRAVSQFLGVALQGAAKSFSQAFTNPSPDLDDLSYYRLSG
ncbi:mucin-2-like isoform X7 [Wyeomyia smithii]|uniref:mucin-2-like isoform X7 n=1 Tax=Wyeomyia smithii TaxID=174621 RepID=UPI002467FD94|nr:mucin-2-like isoform X7 [Wyeomyia smithii]